ncbi:NAD(P)-binding protein [Xylariaceae sp. FL0804]|nr:NAD(P)-binding protein [Xylariaceae sp. FL0804]
MATTLRTTVRPSAGAAAWSRVPHAFVRRKSGPYGYQNAKALVFSEYGEPKDVLKLHQHSISPSLPDGSVLLRTLAAPINPSDVNTIQGTYGAKPTFSPLLGTAEPSAVPGNEGVFEVMAAAPSSASASGPGGDQQLSRGDWVIPARTGFGTWRTHAVAPADALIRIDRSGGLTPVQAGTVAVNPCSAYRMLRSEAPAGGPLREGDWFVQNGANSGVGRAAAQLGRLWGYRSIGVVRARDTPEATDALRAELTELGADRVVTEDEFQSGAFRERARRWTGGAPIRLGLNCVGGRSASAMAKVMGPGGAVVTYGAMSRQPVALPTGPLIFGDLRLVGFWLSRWANADPQAKARTVAELLDLVRAGRLRDSPVAPVPWGWETKDEDLRAAVQGTLEGFRAGKGVFVFGDDT